jgi:hypothetical protein
MYELQRTRSPSTASAHRPEFPAQTPSLSSRWMGASHIAHQIHLALFMKPTVAPHPTLPGSGGCDGMKAVRRAAPPLTAWPSPPLLPPPPLPARGGRRGGAAVKPWVGVACHGEPRAARGQGNGRVLRAGCGDCPQDGVEIRAWGARMAGRPAGAEVIGRGSDGSLLDPAGGTTKGRRWDSDGRVGRFDLL